MYIHNRYDTLQKIVFVEFVQQILYLMGDTRKVVRFYPTELVIPTFQSRLMDGVVEIEDGTLLNIEFQTGNITHEFLLRCAQYAVNLRVISGKKVETKIISTGSRIQSEEIGIISDHFKFKPEIFYYSEFDGLEKLINIKNKIENNEKLLAQDHYNLIFIPLMGHVDKIESAFEVFEIANNNELFTAGEQERIKKCQYVVANIIADGDKNLFERFVREIKMLTMLTEYLEEHEDELFDAIRINYEESIREDVVKSIRDEVTESVREEVAESVREEVAESVREEVAESVKQEVSDNKAIEIASNMKGKYRDEEISDVTGLSIEKVKQL